MKYFYVSYHYFSKYSNSYGAMMFDVIEGEFFDFRTTKEVIARCIGGKDIKVVVTILNVIEVTKKQFEADV